MSKAKARPGCDTGLNFKACVITLSFNELLALKATLTLGKMFTQPQQQECVQKILDRIAVKLKKDGLAQESIDMLCKL
jgi:hypothetical protein